MTQQWFEVTRVEIVSQGQVVGVGECSPHPVLSDPDTFSADLKALQGPIDSKFLAATKAPQISQKFDKPIRNPAVRAGVVMAVLDWLAYRDGQTLWKYLSLPDPGSPPTSFTIPVTSEISELEFWLRKFEASGCASLKIKAGAPDSDPASSLLARLELVRGRYPTCALSIDANRSWPTSHALRLAPELTDLRVQFVEEPLPAAASAREYSLLADSSFPPLFADESIRSESDLLARHSFYSGVVLKQSNWGGLDLILSAAAAARHLGLEVVLGCNGESSIGVSAALHVASIADLCDLDSPLLLDRDKLTYSTFEQGRWQLSDVPGIGIRRTTSYDV